MNVDQERLQAGFAQFVAAARELERGYAELKARTAVVDLELQHANRALQQSLAEREAVFAALPIGLVVLCADGSVQSQNPEAERLCGLAAANAQDLVHHADGDVAFGPCLVRVRRAPLPAGELVLIEDRSHVQRLERQVHRLDRLAGLSELALGIAHEIKNPLNGACGFAALLQRSRDPAEIQRFAQRVAEGLAQVDRIVRELLAFARPGNSASRPQALRSAIDEAASAAGLSRQQVRAHGALDQRVEGAALARVLTNLLRNAAEAAGAGVCVDLTAERTASGQLQIVVRDNGPGVPADLAPRLFQPFVSSKQRGYGLGLALSARVLSFLHGSLVLLNPGQAGAAFKVSVPCFDGLEAGHDQ